MKNILKFSLLLLIVVQISLTTAIPVASESPDDQIDPEHLKPAIETEGEDDEPENFEVDPVVYEDDNEVDPNFEEGDEVLVPIFYPVDDPEEARRMREKHSVEEDDQSPELTMEDEWHVVEYPPGPEASESDEDKSKKSPKPRPSPPPPGKAASPDNSPTETSEDEMNEDDTVVIEACGDYEDECSSSSPTRSEDVVCRAYREQCESNETGEFVDTFFCLSGEC